MVRNKLFENIFQEQKWASTHPSPMSSYKRLKTNSTTTYAWAISRDDDPATVWRLELQAIYEPVVTTGVENDHLVGVNLGSRLFFTLVCSEKVMSRFEWKMLHEEAIDLLEGDWN